jgi:hypothetical protein
MSTFEASNGFKISDKTREGLANDSAEKISQIGRFLDFSKDIQSKSTPMPLEQAFNAVTNEGIKLPGLKPNEIIAALINPEKLKALSTEMKKQMGELLVNGVKQTNGIGDLTKDLAGRAGVGLPEDT